MVKCTRYLIYVCLITLTAYLAWLYRVELNIVSELNDNTFQFAMVAQMEKIFNLVVSGKLSFWYLFDNWNQIWGQGAPLAFYYNHLPQLVTVISYKIIHPALRDLSLFRYFEILKYILFILTPASFYLGAKLLGFSDFASLGTALIAGFISTYGSYGIDASSYLFAGFGLTSQLTAVFLMPLAFGVTDRCLRKISGRYLALAVLLNFSVLLSHIGMGTILLISEVLLVNLKNTLSRFKNLLIVFLLTLVSSAYFLIPMLLTDKFRNYSHWEGLWKFNSFGWQKVIADLLNGQLFDYQRLPIITGLGLLGLFGVLVKRQKWAFLSLGFVFWLVMFFGRTTWGPLFDFLPGLKDFYLHRFIVGIHFFGILLAGLALEFIIHNISKYIKNYQLLAVSLLSLVLILVKAPVIKYAQNNQRLINNANADFIKDKSDFDRIITSLNGLNPTEKRIYAGTPGNWGRSFTVGQTPVYQRLSVLGWPVMTFYAHSWSLSSETEPFFDANRLEHYQIYNVGFIILPADATAPIFAQKIIAAGKYQLFQINTDGYFQAGMPGPQILATKSNFINFVHWWQKSDLIKTKVFPRLSFGLSNQVDHQIVNLNRWQELKSGQEFSLWEKSPFSFPATLASPTAKITQEAILAHQKFSAQVETADDQLLIFSQSYHPNWQAYIDNQPAKKLMVFPAFMAIGVPSGTHQVAFIYQPNLPKKILLLANALLIIILFIVKG